MHVGLLLQMAADGMGDRIALGSRTDGITMAQMATQARRAGTILSGMPGARVALVDLNSEAVPIALFGSALAGKPFVPINYRLSDEQLRDLVRLTAPATVIVGEGVVDRLGPIPGIELIERKEFLERTTDPAVEEVDPYGGDPDSVAVLLFTSGTTGAPKAAVLRNRNLTSYVISTLEFAGAGEDESAIVSVPPYHIAGISSVLSSTYSGRRVVHVETFEPHVWVDLVRAESVTHAMVVPTMLNRILDVVAEDGGGLPSLRSLSYGGGPMPLAVIERAMALLPDVGFVNAYGLTETASTIALLGPDDHREAHASPVPGVRARLASVGRPLPSVEVVVRGADGVAMDSGGRGARIVGARLVDVPNLEHRLDGRDAANRIRREHAQPQRDGAHQLAVDVNRAAAHPAGNVGAQRRAAHLRDDDVLFRPPHIFPAANDFDGDRFRLSALEHGPRHALHARLHLVERKDLHLAGLGPRHRRIGGEKRERSDREPQENRGRVQFHVCRGSSCFNCTMGDPRGPLSVWQMVGLGICNSRSGCSARPTAAGLRTLPSCLA